MFMKESNSTSLWSIGDDEEVERDKLEESKMLVHQTGKRSHAVSGFVQGFHVASGDDTKSGANATSEGCDVLTPSTRTSSKQV